MGHNVERKWNGRKERRQRFIRKEEKKFDVNTLEEVKEIENGQLNSYGGI
jgi:hypothetical protein